MAKNNAQTAQARGNTSSRARSYTFTLNNWTKKELHKILTACETKSWSYVIGSEVGEKGTPHLQGYITNKNPISFSTMKKLMPRAHIEIAVASVRSNYNYCTKSCGDDMWTNIEMIPTRLEKMHKVYEGVVWKDWQQKIIDVMNSKPDSRTIHWVYDKEGNSGKSFLTKYIALNYNVIIGEGKKNDVYNQIFNFLDDDMKDIDAVLLDVPRYGIGYVNYGVLESLKNGLIYSGKYEGGMCMFSHPHVIVFANSKPNLKHWSKDRCVLITIKGNQDESQASSEDSSDSSISL